MGQLSGLGTSCKFLLCDSFWLYPIITFGLSKDSALVMA